MNSMRYAARALLALGYTAGAVLVVLLLTRGSVTTLAARTGASAVFLIFLVLAIVAGVRLARRPAPAGLLGYLTVIDSLAALAVLANVIWSEDPFHEPKRAIALLIASLGLGCASALLDSARSEDHNALRLVRGGTILALAVFAILAILSVLNVHIGPRPAGVAAALFLIGALSLPVLRFATSPTADA